MDESEDEKSTHVDEKRTEGKERGGIGGLENCFFLTCQQFEDRIKGEDERRNTQEKEHRTKSLFSVIEIEYQNQKVGMKKIHLKNIQKI